MRNVARGARTAPVPSATSNPTIARLIRSTASTAADSTSDDAGDARGVRRAARRPRQAPGLPVAEPYVEVPGAVRLHRLDGLEAGLPAGLDADGVRAARPGAAEDLHRLAGLHDEERRAVGGVRGLLGPVLVPEAGVEDLRPRVLELVLRIRGDTARRERGPLRPVDVGGLLAWR